jgi:fructoselysine-6-P-deglycase FrlB-like protein
MFRETPFFHGILEVSKKNIPGLLLSVRELSQTFIRERKYGDRIFLEV